MDTSAMHIIRQLRSHLPGHRVSLLADDKIKSSDVAEARELLRNMSDRSSKSSGKPRTVRLVPRWVDKTTRKERREWQRFSKLHDPVQKEPLPKGSPISMTFVPDNKEAGSITIVFLPLEVGTDYRQGFKFGVSFCSPAEYKGEEEGYLAGKGYNLALERAKSCPAILLDLVQIAKRGGLGDLVSLLLMSMNRPRWINQLKTTGFQVRNLQSLNAMGSVSTIYLFSGVRLNRILGVPDEDEEE